MDSLDKRAQTSRSISGNNITTNSPNTNKLNLASTKDQFTPPKKELSQKSFPIKRLIMVEMTTRREKGVCYHCDKVYTPRHKCKNKQIYIMIIEEEEECKLKEHDHELAIIM